MNIWVISPYGTPGSLKNKKTYRVEDKGFDVVWQYDLKNNTIAIGASRIKDPRGKEKEELVEELLAAGWEKNNARRKARELWLFHNEIKEGDLVIARKGIKVILGFGRVVRKNGQISYYSIERGLERTGNKENPHPNFLNVVWLDKEPIHYGFRVFRVVRFGELSKMLTRRGMEIALPEIKQKINMLRNKEAIKDTVKCELAGNMEMEYDGYFLEKKNWKGKELLPVVYERPGWLLNLIKNIEKLMKDSEHKERAHESLVETFYELLGFVRYDEINYRQGRIDIIIEYNNKPLIVNEVKKDWSLSWRDRKALLQAYNYALETGAPFVVLTNGDYYALFDRRKGYSYESQFVGDFKLTQLKMEDLEIIEKLKKENISFG